jgi:hypothetical protein
VLVDVDDVQPGFGEEARDGRDQAGPIRAGEQEARGVGVRNDRLFGAETALWSQNRATRALAR